MIPAKKRHLPLFMQKSKEILEKYWGFRNFRPLQEDIVDASINGHDVLALLPTGGGKSICFQVPGIAREGITLVVSPLIALMQDQVKNLRKRGIRAQELISGMNYREIDILLDNARFGGIDFLYTSPERLQSALFLERFKNMNVGLIVVDEAHCISEWGHDFRPSYLLIKNLREIHPETPIIAVTATATERVVKDICKQLNLREPIKFEASFLRKNLAYHVELSQNKLREIVDHISSHREETGIVYCQTRKSVKDLTRHLLALKLNAGLYHGGMSKAERAVMLESWLKDEIKIIVCTNAFGMGIDKPDVRYVLHYEFPDNLEAYFQEAGRAGRDEAPAEAKVFYEKSDIIKLKEMIAARFPDAAIIKHTYRALCNYLKIAIGSGKNETYNFDLKDFINKFKLNYLECYNSLKILEMNGDIVFSEGVFHPTKIRIAISNKELYSFQIKYSQYAGFIELVSRSYPGIFDFFYEIDEIEVAKRLKIPKDQVTEILRFLEKHGIMDVSWQSSLPTINFQHERLPDDYLKLAEEVYHKRKNLAEERLLKAIDFLEKETCRIVQLLNYFGQETEKCGNCDVCLRQKRMNEWSGDSVTSLKEFLAVPRTLEEIKVEFSVPGNFLEKILYSLLINKEIKETNGHFSV